jgi:hypothetical protein
MVVARPLDQELLILESLERGLSAHGLGKRNMFGLGRPRTDQALPTLERRLLSLRLHSGPHLHDSLQGPTLLRIRTICGTGIIIKLSLILPVGPAAVRQAAAALLHMTSSERPDLP